MKGDHDPNTNEVYRECLRNHAASLGSYATDGCDEFILDHTSPGSIQCVAYGCHRNFHCRVTYAATSSQAAEGRRSGHHQHHVIMSCSGRCRDLAKNIITQNQFIDYNVGEGGLLDSGERISSGKKQFRTKFTAEQKEKMLAFAKNLGWKLLRKDLEDEIERLCKSVGLCWYRSSSGGSWRWSTRTTGLWAPPPAPITMLRFSATLIGSSSSLPFPSPCIATPIPSSTLCLQRPTRVFLSSVNLRSLTSHTLSNYCNSVQQSLRVQKCQPRSNRRKP
ncbi:hypothetical protein PS2_030401 [Malus domestica]